MSTTPKLPCACGKYIGRHPFPGCPRSAPPPPVTAMLSRCLSHCECQPRHRLALATALDDADALRRDLTEARTALAEARGKLGTAVDMAHDLGARLAVTVGALERIGTPIRGDGDFDMMCFVCHRDPAGCDAGQTWHHGKLQQCAGSIARAALAPTGAPPAKETP